VTARRIGRRQINELLGRLYVLRPPHLPVAAFLRSRAALSLARDFSGGQAPDFGAYVLEQWRSLKIGLPHHELCPLPFLSSWKSTTRSSFSISSWFLFTWTML
jgi:hypothetical protein